MGNTFKGNEKIFWKEVRRVTNGEQARDEVVKDVVKRRWAEVKRRWAEYFEQVLNVADVREANINVVGNWRMPVLGNLNE